MPPVSPLLLLNVDYHITFYRSIEVKQHGVCCVHGLSMMRCRFMLLVSAFGAAHAANICGSNATLGSAVIDVLNLTYPGLSAVKAAVERSDMDAACEALAAYYVSSNTSSWLRIPPVTPGTARVGNGSYVDDAVDYDIYWLAGVDTTGKIPRNKDGGLDWLNKGPRVRPVHI